MRFSTKVTQHKTVLCSWLDFCQEGEGFVQVALPVIKLMITVVLPVDVFDSPLLEDACKTIDSIDHKTVLLSPRLTLGGLLL